MAYQALYRKYRPAKLEDVVGQEAIVATLRHAVSENKISHAYLFTGPRGTGKTSVAKLYAKMVNCLAPKNGDPCNECDICQKIDNKEVSDIIEIDAASNNGVDEIREIRNKANLAPSLCKYKVYIIDEVHMLSTGAFNALLKTLEEPPSHVIFILATTEIHKIPLTIMSRCQRFDFKKISTLKLTERLKYIADKEQISISELALIHIAEICDGGMRDSISLLDQLSGYCENEITVEDVDVISGNISTDEILNFIDNIFQGDHQYILDKIREYNDTGKNLLKFVEKLVIHLRNILLFANAKDYFLKNYTNCDSYEALAQKVDHEEQIYQIIDHFNHLLVEMKNNTDYQTLLEIKMLKIMSSVSKKESFISSNKKEPVKEEMLTKKTEESVAQETISLSKEKRQVETLSFSKLIQIRVNNTFYNADKQILLDLKNRWYQINQYTVDVQYADAASLLLDSELKAAGTKNLIIVYPYDSMANRANHELAVIEKLLQQALQITYKVIAISSEQWQEYYNDFLKKWKNKEKYQYIEEDDTASAVYHEVQDPLIDEALELFGDLVKIE